MHQSVGQRFFCHFSIQAWRSSILSANLEARCKIQEDSSSNGSNQNKSKKPLENNLSECIALIHGIKSNNIHKEK